MYKKIVFIIFLVFIKYGNGESNFTQYDSNLISMRSEIVGERDIRVFMTGQKVTISLK
jgi:hypothetical protein